MYMESRKMLLKNSFIGQQWKTDIENRHRYHRYGERGGEGEMYGKSNGNLHYHM